MSLQICITYHVNLELTLSFTNLLGILHAHYNYELANVEHEFCEITSMLISNPIGAMGRQSDRVELCMLESICQLRKHKIKLEEDISPLSSCRNLKPTQISKWLTRLPQETTFQTRLRAQGRVYRSIPHSLLTQQPL